MNAVHEEVGVRIRFPMSERNWDKVITEGLETDENPTWLNEDSRHFVVEYDTREQADAAIARLSGEIEYEELA